MSERPTTDPLERFWKYIERSEDANGCWLWTGARTADGYGNFWEKGRWFRAHRWAYLRLVGEIPQGLQIDHLCRNPLCVNPAHLEPVTSRENTLRGESFAARNSRKTHCKHGHEFTPENTDIDANGNRQCRACWKRRYAERVKRGANVRRRRSVLRQNLEAVLMDANVTYSIVGDDGSSSPMLVEREAIVKAMGYEDEAAWLIRVAEINAAGAAAHGDTPEPTGKVWGPERMRHDPERGSR